LSLLALGTVTEARGQGTVEFKNYYWHYDGTNRWREDRPILLADGATRAAGSNIVVELWVKDPHSSQLQFVRQTELLDGDRAGLFDGGYVELLPIGRGSTAIIEVRAWDKTTGTNYGSTTIKGATAFENHTGGWGLPPTLPEPLIGFHSFCLGNSDGVARPAMVDFSSDYLDGASVVGALAQSEFIVASTAASKSIRLHRSGELIASTTVTYRTCDETATNGVDYVQQAGNITFLPYETIRTFDVPILSSASRGRVGSVSMAVHAEDGMPERTVNGRLWILGDRASLITDSFFQRPGRTDGFIFWIYCQTHCVVDVEFSDSVDQPAWRTLTRYSHFYPSGPAAVGAYDDQTLGISRRFYRLVVR
jgi:hypothetical protein